MKLKTTPYRNKKYLEYVSELPSCISGIPADDAHHIKGNGFGGTTKPSDLMVIPLTRMEHAELHNIGWKSWEEKYGSQMKFVLLTFDKAIRDGFPF